MPFLSSKLSNGSPLPSESKPKSFFMAYKAVRDTVLVTGLTSTPPPPHYPHPAHSIPLCWPLVQALQTHSHLGVFAIVLSSAWNTFPQIPARLNPSLPSRLCSNLTFSFSLCEILLPASLQYFQSPRPTLLFIFYRAPISLGHTKSFPSNVYYLLANFPC